MPRHTHLSSPPPPPPPPQLPRHLEPPAPSRAGSGGMRRARDAPADCTLSRGTALRSGSSSSGWGGVCARGARTLARPSPKPARELSLRSVLALPKASRKGLHSSTCGGSEDGGGGGVTLVPGRHSAGAALHRCWTRGPCSFPPPSSIDRAGARRARAPPPPPSSIERTCVSGWTRGPAPRSCEGLVRRGRGQQRGNPLPLLPMGAGGGPGTGSRSVKRPAAAAAAAAGRPSQCPALQRRPGASRGPPPPRAAAAPAPGCGAGSAWRGSA